MKMAMKKLLTVAVTMIVGLMLIAAPVCAEATALARDGHYGYITQYKIDDPGGPYHNHIVYTSASIEEVVIQKSGTNMHTFKENWLCWENGEVLECPDDDLDPPNEVWRMPVLKQLADIQMAGNVDYTGADLSELTTKSIYLAFWHEYKMKKVAADSVAGMVLEEFNALQQRRSLKYVYFGHGLDLSTAQSIANNYITNSTLPTYDVYGIATVPLQDRRLLILFGEVGWFEPAPE